MPPGRVKPGQHGNGKRILFHYVRSSYFNHIQYTCSVSFQRSCRRNRLALGKPLCFSFSLSLSLFRSLSFSLWFSPRTLGCQLFHQHLFSHAIVHLLVMFSQDAWWIFANFFTNAYSVMQYACNRGFAFDFLPGRLVIFGHLFHQHVFHNAIVVLPLMFSYDAWWFFANFFTNTYSELQDYRITELSLEFKTLNFQMQRPRNSRITEMQGYRITEFSNRAQFACKIPRRTHAAGPLLWTVL